MANENKKEKGFFERAFDDMKESARKQKEIDKENFEAIKADSKARFEEAKKVDPDFQEFKDAEGLKEKAKVVFSHMERDGKKIAEENQKKHKEMLEENRKKMNETINGNK